MTYSIFDGSGNLIDVFTDHAAALACLAGISRVEPVAAAEVFLIAQGDAGEPVGDTVSAPSVSANT